MRGARSRGGAQILHHGPRRIPAIAVAVLLTAALAGCQKGIDVGVHNACGFPIEVDMNSISPPDSYIWARLNDGDRRGVRFAGEVATEDYVWVRTAEGDPVNEFTVRKADLAPPPEGYDYDLEIVLEGDRCPGGADQDAERLPATRSST